MVEGIMKIEDEDPIPFTLDGVSGVYSIKSLVGDGETCSDEEYEKRIDICRSCDKFLGEELCAEGNFLSRVNCRMSGASCPLNKW